MAAFGAPFSSPGFGGLGGFSTGISSTSSFPGFPGFPSPAPAFSYPSIPTAASPYTTASPSSALLSGKYPSTTPGYTQAPPRPPMKKAKRVRRRVVEEDSISDPGPDYDYGDYFKRGHVPSEEGNNEIPQAPEPQPLRRGQPAGGVPPVWNTENGKGAPRKQYSPRQYTSPVQDQAQFPPFSSTSARSLPTSVSRGSVTPSRTTLMTETSYAKENIGMEGDHPRDISSRLKDQKYKVASAAFSSKSNRWGSLYPKIDGHAARTERHRIARQQGMGPSTTVTEWEEQQRRAMEDEERKFHAAQTGVFEAWQPRDPFSDPTQPTMVF